MSPVASSSIRAIGYDRVRRLLFIDYVASAGRYVYEGVPPEIHVELLAAPSKGRFVNFRIKNHYPYRLIMADPRQASFRRRSQPR